MKAVMGPMEAPEGLGTTAMHQGLYTPAGRNWGSRAISSPVTGSNPVVDLLQLDTRYTEVVGFLPIKGSGEEISMTPARSSESSTQTSAQYSGGSGRKRKGQP